MKPYLRGGGRFLDNECPFRAGRCPVQEEIFPALGRARSGDGLEARFSAFKMPETNMLSFEARVRTCKRECEPVSNGIVILLRGHIRPFRC